MSYCWARRTELHCEPATAPLFDGSNDGQPSKAIAKGYRQIQANGLRREECYCVPDMRYRLSSTNTLAELGISTLVDSTRAGNPLILLWLLFFKPDQFGKNKCPPCLPPAIIRNCFLIARDFVLNDNLKFAQDLSCVFYS